MNNPNDWPVETWQEIQDAVLVELGNVRVCQKVFPTELPSDNTGSVIPNEVVNFDELSVIEGLTKQFVELRVLFSLTYAQMISAPESKIGRTLTKMAGKIAGLTEDGILLQGENLTLPANVQVDRLTAAGQGLLAEAEHKDADDNDPNKISEPIDVPLVKDRPGRLYAENTFSAVTKGISKLVSKGQAPAYALMLPPEVYADAHVPESDGKMGTYADAIRALLDGGLNSASLMPPGTGLLVALAGDPIKLYEGIVPNVSYVRQEGSKFYFNLTARIQFVALDPRSMVLLRFEQPQTTAKSRRTSSKK